MRALVQRPMGRSRQAWKSRRCASRGRLAQDVCVRVRYAGINPLDWKLVEGHFKWMSKARPPCGVGFDLAGEVHDAGRGAAGFAQGTRVAGLIPAFKRPPGSIAQYALVPARLLVEVPDRVPLDQAAALPVAGLSALQMCRMATDRPRDARAGSRRVRRCRAPRGADRAQPRRSGDRDRQRGQPPAAAVPRPGSRGRSRRPRWPPGAAPSTPCSIARRRWRRPT